MVGNFWDNTLSRITGTVMDLSELDGYEEPQEFEDNDDIRLEDRTEFFKYAPLVKVEFYSADMSGNKCLRLNHFDFEMVGPIQEILMTAMNVVASRRDNANRITAEVFVVDCQAVYSIFLNGDILTIV
jgi:hypothetical protein